VPRFVLPVRCLRDALAGDVDASIESLERARVACAPHEWAEAALDVAGGLLAHGQGGATRDLVARFIPLSEDLPQRAIRYRMEELRSALLLEADDVDGARACLARARDELDRLLERMEDRHRGQMLENPWVKELQRVRAVP
jgi:hypothetical protein